MTVVARTLRLDHDRWARLTPEAFWPATALVVGAFALLAMLRLGGLILDSPRAFLRLTLIGVHGWLLMGVAIWLLAERTGRLGAPTTESRSPLLTLAAVGLAHLPLLALALAVFVSAGMFETLGPGAVVAAFVAGFWFPASLVMAVSHGHRLDLLRSALIVALPYLVWLATVGRHFHDRIQHLL